LGINNQEKLNEKIIEVITTDRNTLLTKIGELYYCCSQQLYDEVYNLVVNDEIKKLKQVYNPICEKCNLCIHLSWLKLSNINQKFDKYNNKYLFFYTMFKKVDNPYLNEDSVEDEYSDSLVNCCYKLDDQNHEHHVRSSNLVSVVTNTQILWSKRSYNYNLNSVGCMVNTFNYFIDSCVELHEANSLNYNARTSINLIKISEIMYLMRHELFAFLIAINTNNLIKTNKGLNTDMNVTGLCGITTDQTPDLIAYSRSNNEMNLIEATVVSVEDKLISTKGTKQKTKYQEICRQLNKYFNCTTTTVYYTTTDLKSNLEDVFDMHKFECHSQLETLIKAMKLPHAISYHFSLSKQNKLPISKLIHDEVDNFEKGVMKLNNYKSVPKRKIKITEYKTTTEISRNLDIIIHSINKIIHDTELDKNLKLSFELKYPGKTKQMSISKSARNWPNAKPKDQIMQLIKSRNINELLKVIYFDGKSLSDLPKGVVHFDEVFVNEESTAFIATKIVKKCMNAVVDKKLIVPNDEEMISTLLPSNEIIINENHDNFLKTHDQINLSIMRGQHKFNSTDVLNADPFSNWVITETKMLKAISDYKLMNNNFIQTAQTIKTAPIFIYPVPGVKNLIKSKSESINPHDLTFFQNLNLTDQITDKIIKKSILNYNNPKCMVEDYTNEDNSKQLMRAFYNKKKEVNEEMLELGYDEKFIKNLAKNKEKAGIYKRYADSLNQDNELKLKSLYTQLDIIDKEMKETRNASKEKRDLLNKNFTIVMNKDDIKVMNSTELSHWNNKRKYGSAKRESLSPETRENCRDLINVLINYLSQQITDDVELPDFYNRNPEVEYLAEGMKTGSEYYCKSRLSKISKFISKFSETLLYMSNTNIKGNQFHVSNLGFDNVIMLVRGGEKITKTSESRMYRLLVPLDNELFNIYQKVSPTNYTIIEFNGINYVLLPWSKIYQEVIDAGINIYESNFLSVSSNITTFEQENESDTKSYHNLFLQPLLSLCNHRKVEQFTHNMRYILNFAFSEYGNVNKFLPSTSQITTKPIIAALQQSVENNYYASYLSIKNMCSGMKGNKQVNEHFKSMPMLNLLTNQLMSTQTEVMNLLYCSYNMSKGNYNQTLEQRTNYREIEDLITQWRDDTDEHNILYTKMMNDINSVSYEEIYKVCSKSTGANYTNNDYNFYLGRILSSHIRIVKGSIELVQDWLKTADITFTSLVNSAGLRYKGKMFYGHKSAEVFAQYCKDNKILIAKDDEIYDIMVSSDVDVKKRKKLMQIHQDGSLQIYMEFGHDNEPFQFHIVDKEQKGGNRPIKSMSLHTKLIQNPVENFFGALCKTFNNEYIHVPSDERAGKIHNQIFSDHQNRDVFYGVLDCTKWAPNWNLNKWIDLLMSSKHVLPVDCYYILMYTIMKMYKKEMYVSKHMLRKRITNEEYAADPKRYVVDEVGTKNLQTKGFCNAFDTKTSSDDQPFLVNENGFYKYWPFSFVMGIFNKFSSLVHVLAQTEAANSIKKAFYQFAPERDVEVNFGSHSDDAFNIFSGETIKIDEAARMMNIWQRCLYQANLMLSPKKCYLSTKLFEFVSIFYINRQFTPLYYKFFLIKFTPTDGGYMSDITQCVSKLNELIINGAPLCIAWLACELMSNRIRRHYNIPYDINKPVFSFGAPGCNPIKYFIMGSGADDIRLSNSDPISFEKHVRTMFALGFKYDEKGMSFKIGPTRNFGKFSNIQEKRNELNNEYPKTLQLLEDNSIDLSSANVKFGPLFLLKLAQQYNKDKFALSVSQDSDVKRYIRMVQDRKMKNIRTDFGLLDITTCRSLIKLMLSEDETIKLQLSTTFQKDAIKNNEYNEIVANLEDSMKNCKFDSAQYCSFLSEFHSLDDNLTSMIPKTYSLVKTTSTCKPCVIDMNIGVFDRNKTMNADCILMSGNDNFRWLLDNVTEHLANKELLLNDLKLRNYKIEDMDDNLLRIRISMINKFNHIKKYFYSSLPSQDRVLKTYDDLQSMLNENSLPYQRIQITSTQKQNTINEKLKKSMDMSSAMYLLGFLVRFSGNDNLINKTKVAVKDNLDQISLTVYQKLRDIFVIYRPILLKMNKIIGSVQVTYMLSVCSSLKRELNDLKNYNFWKVRQNFNKITKNWYGNGTLRCKLNGTIMELEVSDNVISLMRTEHIKMGLLTPDDDEMLKSILKFNQGYMLSVAPPRSSTILTLQGLSHIVTNYTNQEYKTSIIQTHLDEQRAECLLEDLAMTKFGRFQIKNRRGFITMNLNVVGSFDSNHILRTKVNEIFDLTTRRTLNEFITGKLGKQEDELVMQDFDSEIKNGNWAEAPLTKFCNENIDDLSILDKTEHNIRMKKFCKKNNLSYNELGILNITDLIKNNLSVDDLDEKTYKELVIMLDTDPIGNVKKAIKYNPNMDANALLNAVARLNLDEIQQYTIKQNMLDVMSPEKINTLEYDIMRLITKLRDYFLKNYDMISQNVELLIDLPRMLTAQNHANFFTAYLVKLLMDCSENSYYSHIPISFLFFENLIKIYLDEYKFEINEVELNSECLIRLFFMFFKKRSFQNKILLEKLNTNDLRESHKNSENFKTRLNTILGGRMNFEEKLTLIKQQIKSNYQVLTHDFEKIRWDESNLTYMNIISWHDEYNSLHNELNNMQSQLKNIVPPLLNGSIKECKLAKNETHSEFRIHDKIVLVIPSENVQFNASMTMNQTKLDEYIEENFETANIMQEKGNLDSLINDNLNTNKYLMFYVDKSYTYFICGSTKWHEFNNAINKKLDDLEYLDEIDDMDYAELDETSSIYFETESFYTFMKSTKDKIVEIESCSNDLLNDYLTETINKTDRIISSMIIPNNFIKQRNMQVYTTKVEKGFFPKLIYSHKDIHDENLRRFVHPGSLLNFKSNVNNTGIKKALNIDKQTNIMNNKYKSRSKNKEFEFIGISSDEVYNQQQDVDMIEGEKDIQLLQDTSNFVTKIELFEKFCFTDCCKEYIISMNEEDYFVLQLRLIKLVEFKSLDFSDNELMLRIKNASLSITKMLSELNMKDVSLTKRNYLSIIENTTKEINIYYPLSKNEELHSNYKILFPHNYEQICLGNISMNSLRVQELGLRYKRFKDKVQSLQDRSSIKKYESYGAVLKYFIKLVNNKSATTDSEINYRNLDSYLHKLVTDLSSTVDAHLSDDDLLAEAKKLFF